MIMLYLTIGFMVAAWIVLGAYIYWVTSSGYEQSVPAGDSA